MIKAKSVDSYLKEKMKDPCFKEQWELEEQKLELVKPIIAYRIKNNLNQKALAAELNVTQQHISDIENGRFSSIATLEKVLRHVGFKIYMEAVPIKERKQKKGVRSHK